MNNIGFRISRLGGTFVAFFVVLCFALAMVAVNYMMLVQGLKLFFERAALHEDQLVGPYLSEFGAVELHQLFALIIAAAVTGCLTLLVHQVRQMFRGDWRTATLDRWMFLGALLVVTAIIVYLDYMLFAFRMTQFLFTEKFDEDVTRIPDLWKLIAENQGYFAATMVQVGALAYIAISVLAALALDHTWTSFQESYEDAAELLFPNQPAANQDVRADADVDLYPDPLAFAPAAPAAAAGVGGNGAFVAPGVASNFAPAGSNGHAHRNGRVDPDMPIRVEGSPGELLTHAEAGLRPDTYHICHCGQISLNTHYKIYGCPQCVSSNCRQCVGVA